MTTDQQLLTDTAAMVQEAADKATQGPWVAEHRGFDVYEAKSNHGDVVAEAGLSPADAAYIALMHPGVGRTLAELLRRIEQFDHPAMCPTRFSEDNCNCPKSAALAVARALRGDQP